MTIFNVYGKTVGFFASIFSILNQNAIVFVEMLCTKC